jgi:hypothetical protein
MQDHNMEAPPGKNTPPKAMVLCAPVMLTILAVYTNQDMPPSYQPGPGGSKVPPQHYRQENGEGGENVRRNNTT